MKQPDLVVARRRLAELSSAVNVLARDRRRAEADAERLDQRARVPRADPRLAELAARHRAHAIALGARLDAALDEVRCEEAHVEELMARERGV